MKALYRLIHIITNTVAKQRDMFDDYFRIYIDRLYIETNSDWRKEQLKYLTLTFRYHRKRRSEP